MDFNEVNRRYVDLKRQHDEGTLSAEAFDAQLKEMMIQDDQGRWWAKARDTGHWSYHDGTQWIRSDPPGVERAVAPPPPVAPGAPNTISGPAPVQPAQVQGAPQYQQPATGATAAQPLSSGMAIVLYVASFLIPIAGLVIWAMYRDKPFESDRNVARISLAVAGLSVLIGCGCSILLVAAGGGY